MDILFEDGFDRSELYWSWETKTLIAYVPNRGIRITTVSGADLFLKPGSPGYEELEERCYDAPFWNQFVISGAGAGSRHMMSLMSIEEVADFPGYLPMLEPSCEGTVAETLEAVQDSLKEWEDYIARESEWVEDSNPFYY